MDDQMNPEHPSSDELLIWRILGKLESLALRRYETAVPQLATPEKRELVNRLLEQAPDDAALDASPLGDPVRELLSAADGRDETGTLIVQGFILERLGQVIYKILSAHHAASEATRELAVAGTAACSHAIGQATHLLREQFGSGERLHDLFFSTADGVLRRLDGLGDGVDRLFGQRFGLTFSELLGEFTADLLPACMDLGMSRRKLVCRLAGVFMGV
jgi:hypothetical protein